MQEQQNRPEQRREETPEPGMKQEKASLPEMNRRTGSLRKMEPGKACLPKAEQKTVRLRKTEQTRESRAEKEPRELLRTPPQELKLNPGQKGSDLAVSQSVHALSNMKGAGI